MTSTNSITYDAGKNGWRIDAPPHLVIKLKRIFPKIPKTHYGEVFLTDTVETARDLEWFLDRHPLEVSATDRSLLTTRSSLHKERQSIVEAMLAKKMTPPEFDLAIRAREYQRQAAALCLQSGGLLLADDLGIGKTVSAICMLTDRRTLPALVVTMTHLPKQWEAELNRFAPKLRVHILKKGTPYDLAERPRRRRRSSRPIEDGDQLSLPAAPVDALPDVIIANYHKLDGWASTLAPLIEGHAVIFDEVQELRHPDSRRYAAAMWLAQHAGFRCGLSATPINNMGSEYFNVLDALFPGQLGTKAELIQEWCKEGQSKALADPAAFGSYLRSSGLMLRRTRSDVGRELPKLTKVVQTVQSDWSPAVMEQDNGRVDRDGQKDPVVAYYLISEEGSDPILVDILGLKRQQSDGVREVEADLVERLEVDGDRIKKLAESYLRGKGIALPQPPSAEEGAAA